VKINRLKIYFYVWAALAIITVWLDRWIAVLSFGTISCLLGAVVATTPIESDQQRKKFKQLGVLMMVGGCVMSLLMLAERFIIGYAGR